MVRRNCQAILFIGFFAARAHQTNRNPIVSAPVMIPHASFIRARKAWWWVALNELFYDFIGDAVNFTQRLVRPAGNGAVKPAGNFPINQGFVKLAEFLILTFELCDMDRQAEIGRLGKHVGGVFCNDGGVRHQEEGEIRVLAIRSAFPESRAHLLSEGAETDTSMGWCAPRADNPMRWWPRCGGR